MKFLLDGLRQFLLDGLRLDGLRLDGLRLDGLLLDGLRLDGLRQLEAGFHPNESFCRFLPFSRERLRFDGLCNLVLPDSTEVVGSSMLMEL